MKTKARLRIPVFIYKDNQGQVRYDIHGVVDWMVVNAEKRREMEGDMWSCFQVTLENEGGLSWTARLVWLHVDLDCLGETVTAQEITGMARRPLRCPEGIE